MQLRPLFLTGLLLSAPVLSFPFSQDEGGRSLELAEQARADAERTRADAEQARVEAEQAAASAHLLLQQAREAQEKVAAMRIIPAPKLKETREQDLDRGYLGIQMRIEDGAMVVVDVKSGSGADEAGLEAGDRILRVNKIRFAEDGAVEKLAKLKCCETAKVTFERDGNKDQVNVELRPLPHWDAGDEPRVEFSRVRELAGGVEQDKEKHLERRVRVLAPQDVEVHVDASEGLVRATKPRLENGQVFELKLDGEGLDQFPDHIRQLIKEHGSDGEVQIRMRRAHDHNEDGGNHEVHVLHLGDGDGEWISREAHGHADSRSEASGNVLFGDGEAHVMELKLDGESLHKLPEHIRELINEHGSDGNQHSRGIFISDDEHAGRLHEGHGDGEHGGPGFYLITGDHQGDDHDGHDAEGRTVDIMALDLDGEGLEGLPEHIRELIRERGGDGEQRTHRIVIRDDEHGSRPHEEHNGDEHGDHFVFFGGDSHQNHEHDGHDSEEHEVHIMHLDEGGDRTRRLHGEVHVNVEVEHDGRNEHDHHQAHGKAIIKILSGDGDRTMEFDFDGEDMRGLGGHLRELLGGHDLDLRDILARIRGERGDRRDRGERGPGGLHREQDHGSDGPRPRVFEGRRGMGRGMQRNPGGGRPHEAHDEGSDETVEHLEGRIEELEERIEELEELLQRLRGRRDR